MSLVTFDKIVPLGQDFVLDDIPLTLTLKERAAIYDTGQIPVTNMDGIAFGDIFIEQITDTVRSSKCMLYFGSSYTNKSKWAVKELLYALKIGIKILPLKLDDAPYPPEIMFAIGNINWFESNLRSREDMEKLLDVISKLLDD